jgi:HEAT repeat protein
MNRIRKIEEGIGGEMPFLRLIIVAILLIVCTLGAVLFLFPSNAIKPSSDSGNSWPEDRFHKDMQSLKQEISILVASNTLITREQLRWALENPSESVRYQAILAIGNDMSKTTIDFLIDRACNDPSPQVRCYALRLLALRKRNEVQQLIFKSVMDPSPAVQETATWLLIQEKQNDAAPFLIEAIESGLPSKPVVNALGGLRHPDAVLPLLQISERHPLLLTEVREALIRIGDNAVPRIAAVLRSPNSQAQTHFLIDVLQSMKSREADAILADLVEEPAQQN